MSIMLENQSNNPTEAIGKAKELIESCCKTILAEELSKDYAKGYSARDL